MNKISVNELEQKIEAGEEVVDTCFDASTTRVGKVYTKVSRRKYSAISKRYALRCAYLVD
ncbi:hypothetical protein [Crocosphaera sp. Alani8]|uniref:hypothetical protein n=1 Tax=Crocosphaera sp. Alani8 TaxID=3038952 RepID=UPI00313D3C03